MRVGKNESSGSLRRGSPGRPERIGWYKEDFLEEVSRNWRRGALIWRTIVLGRREMAWHGLRRLNVGVWR